MMAALILIAVSGEPRAVSPVTNPFVPSPSPGCLRSLVTDPSDARTLYGYFSLLADLRRSDDGGVSWLDLHGPPVNIDSLAVSPLDSARVFATADGFYVSDDRGETWQRSSSAPPDLNGRLVFSRFSPESIYVASNSFRGGTYVGEMWFSPDEGAHWMQKENGLPLGAPASPIGGLVASPHDPGVLLVGTSNGVYGTEDGGDDWERLSAEVVFPIGFDAISSSVVWGQNGDSLFLSADRGSTWQPITVDNDCCPEAAKSLLALEPDPVTPGAAYALVERVFPYPLFPDVVVRTLDYGASWQFVGDGIDALPTTQLLDLVLSADGRTMWVSDCGTPAVYRRDLLRPRAVPER